ncbi:MAG: threo-3-hydroxy-L-aspartate ammonia-lyase [Candidatus Bipolaricaulia bacterium]
MAPVPSVRFSDVEAAAERLQPVARRTPVMTSRSLDDQCGNRVFLKCENFQRMGAFKFRGAYNAMSRLSDEQKRKGVLTYSSGNHAQAVALSGQLLEIPTTIIMPNDAPQVKLDATRGYGAEVVLYDRAESHREDIAQELADERGLTVVPPFDHPHIVAGQGTAAKELFEDVGELDVLLVCCGGGGLLGGSAISASALSPSCRVIGVEPEAGDDGVRSFQTGTIQTVENPDTIADGARTHFLSELTLSIILDHADDMITASDAELVATMRFLWERMKLVVEPTGVLGLAPLFHGHLDEVRDQRVGVLVSGGNVDLTRACQLFREAESAR